MGDFFSLQHLIVLLFGSIIYIGIPYLIYRAIMAIKNINSRLSKIEESIKRIEENRPSST